MINRAWNLSFGFLLWNIWKERNHRIFRGEEKSINQIWQQMLDNIRETILVEKWLEEHWKMEGIETQMLARLNLKPEMMAITLWKYIPHCQNLEDKWKAPQNGFIKLNYDGASKGNPRKVGAGGIFRNSRGESCRF